MICGFKKKLGRATKCPSNSVWFQLKVKFYTSSTKKNICGALPTAKRLLLDNPFVSIGKASLQKKIQEIPNDPNQRKLLKQIRLTFGFQV